MWLTYMWAYQQNGAINKSLTVFNSSPFGTSCWKLNININQLSDKLI